MRGQIFLWVDIDADHATVAQTFANGSQEECASSKERSGFDDHVRSCTRQDLLVDPEVEWGLSNGFSQPESALHPNFRLGVSDIKIPGDFVHMAMIFSFGGAPDRARRTGKQ